VTDSIRQRLVDWQLNALVTKYPGLRIVPTDEHVKVIGVLAFSAEAPEKERISDEYEIEISIPYTFPKPLAAVRETARRIPWWFHKLNDGSLCLGAPTRLRLLMTDSGSILEFVERCVVPYLYGHSYLEKHGTLPFGELPHGNPGLSEDLASLFGVGDESAVRGFVEVTAMRKRQANKQACPCGSRHRLGRCHNRCVNQLRQHLGRGWFRLLRYSFDATPASGPRPSRLWQS
jgi:hypothetical protein